jgi:hypothetical protein
VTEVPVLLPDEYRGGVIVKELSVSSASDNKPIFIQEVRSRDQEITTPGEPQFANSPIAYYFYTNGQIWMSVEQADGESGTYCPLNSKCQYVSSESSASTTADVSNTTMGGLPILGGELVPLGTYRFLVITTSVYREGAPLFPKPFINSIVSINQSAVPSKSIADQVQTIQAEAGAYMSQQ